MALETLSVQLAGQSSSSCIEVVVHVQSHRDVKIENVGSIEHACVRAKLLGKAGEGVVVLARCPALARMIFLAGQDGDYHDGPKQILLSLSNVMLLLERLGIQHEEKKKEETEKKKYKLGDLTKGLIKRVDKAINSCTMDSGDYPKNIDISSLQLVLGYRACTVETCKSVLAAGVSDLLLRHKLVSAARLDAEEYTWYKLSEWMQVEMLSVFAGQLETVPWYRFPFLATLQVLPSLLLSVLDLLVQKYKY